MMKKRKKFTNKWRKLLVIGLAVLIGGSTSLQQAVALENDFGNRDKKVKNEKQEDFEKYIPGQVIIKLKEGVSSDDEFLDKHELKSAEKLLKENKSEKNIKAMQAMKKYGLDRIYLAEFSSEKDLAKVIKKLNKDPKVEYAEPNYEVKIDVIPNDPFFPELWGLNNTGQTGGALDADIDAPDVWDIETGKDNVVIAVIDTGVDYNHEDLADNIWVNEVELNGIAGTDDDGNGCIDDVHGCNFVNSDNPTGNPFDDHGHGTHCAGTIGAIGHNGIGVVGVNWDVTIMPIKFLSSGGGGDTFGAIASVNYATLMGVDVMSNSWGGGGFTQSLEDAISAANDAGILFIAAAGNSNSNNDLYPHYPSSYDIPNVIAVAATDHNDNKASFSCFGATSVDLGAPGVSIYSTVPTGSCELCDPSGYKYLNGTSMATPHVAGAVGLIRAEYPTLSGEDLKTRLLGGVDSISSMDGITVTGGRLNILNSIEEDIIPPASVSILAVTGATCNSISLSWLATGDDGNTGTASSYDVRYSIYSIVSETDWNNATQAQDEPSPQPYNSTENFTVENLGFDTTYHFALKVVDNVGNRSGFSNSVSETTEAVTIAFKDDMESGASGWTHGGTNDNWELGSPTSGPGNASSGLNVWATNLDGNYEANNMNAQLVSPSINLNGISLAKLAFQHYYHTENYWDGGIVEISTDGGASWTQVMPEGGYPEDALSGSNPLGPVSAYSGYSGVGWHPAVFDISSYDGYSNINIRFRFGTDSSISYYSGWYIDDVVIFGQDNGGNIPPVADAGGNQTGDVQKTMSFNGSASYDSDGLIVSYLWDFGDGTTGTGVTVDHVYQNGGTYNVTLVVMDEDGSIGQDVVEVIIRDPIPPAAIYDLSETELETTSDSVMLDWTAVGDDGLIGTASYYDIRYSTSDIIDETDWNNATQAQGEPFPQISGSKESFTVENLEFNTTYYFAIKVIDDVDNVSYISNVVEITTLDFENTLPIVYLGAPDSGYVDESIEIYGEAYDPDEDLITYKWDFGDGSTKIGNEPMVIHSYASEKIYTITLIVNDGIGDSLPATADIEIKLPNQPPVADAGSDQTKSDIDGDGVETVTLDGSGSYDPDETVLSYAWFEDLGSGISSSPICTGVSPECDFSVGTHTVILIVTDNDLATASDTVTIIVNPNQSPIANIVIDQIVGETVDFNGSGSNDPDGDIVSYEWDFGDGTTGSEVSPIHVYDSYGDHTVTLTVTDNGDAIDTVTIVIEIQDIVTITKAMYDTKKETLTIEATSSAMGEAVLTASAGRFENMAMRYDSRLGVFKVTIRKIISPFPLTVSSSLEGSDTCPPFPEE